MNRMQVLLLFLLIGFVALVWLGTGRVPTPAVSEALPPVVQPSPVTQPEPPVTAPVAQPSPAAPEASTTAEAPSFVGPLNLIIPVAGVRSDQLVDTFTASR